MDVEKLESLDPASSINRIILCEVKKKMYSEYKKSCKEVIVIISDHMAQLGIAFPVTITNHNKDGILTDL